MRLIRYGMILCLFLTSAEVFGSCIEITWTATGDDGAVGQASYYDIRYSTVPISEANWNQAARITTAKRPQPPGREEYLLVSGLQPSTRYYFALKVGDERPNWSALSNLASKVTSSYDCEGSTGNINCSADGMVDVSDLTHLIDHLFITFRPLCCKNEANTDGSGDGGVDVADLTRLIENLFVNFRETAPCQ